MLLALDGAALSFAAATLTLGSLGIVWANGVWGVGRCAKAGLRLSESELRIHSSLDGAVLLLQTDRRFGFVRLVRPFVLANTPQSNFPLYVVSTLQLEE